MWSLLAIGCLFSYMWWEAHRNRVVSVELSFPTFPESVRALTIFFISDIHRRVVSEKLLARVKGNVDFVVIGGDLMEKGVPFHRVKENIRRLKQIGPVYFVWGNNDYEADYRELDALLWQEGVHVLANSAAMFESELGEKVALIGIDDISKRRAHLDLAIAEVDQSAFRIVVCHNPDIVRIIQPQHGISLVLSGHTHGGQIRLGRFGLYEKGGVKEGNGTTLFVSNGYGTTNVPFRFGVPAEVNIVTIRRGKGDDREV
ncbi:metallophosphoesterase [Anoxybacteroides amylolyticum]|uniref:Calcineurin-like phosphoesterase family protein n=1 Tax=Anoxybacteroides amylolyticum TaxID=294699 RepID=A0A161HU60_9BACL|nr:metallophosphoesterase [Anoxybacillus amylolyticus]ANB59934.1 calcineurin-like phosphoesterase family protein [Anoxybacillus amylolyticus]